MKFVIPNIVFVILIAISTGYLTFLTTKGSLTSDNHSRLWDKLTKRGKIVFFLLIAIAIILSYQEYNNQVSNENKDILLTKERNQRDSLVTNGINSGVESNSNRLFNKLSLAFANQNLKIDTLKNTVVKIKGSVKPTINNYPQDVPVFSIEAKGVRLKSLQNANYEYEVDFRSLDAGSANYKVDAHMFTEYQNNTYSLTKPNLLANVKIPKNGKWTIGFQVNSVIPIKNIYLYFVGNYTTLDGIKSYPIDDIYLYEESNKTTWTLMNPERNKIISQIKDYQKRK